MKTKPYLDIHSVNMLDINPIFRNTQQYYKTMIQNLENIINNELKRAQNLITETECHTCKGRCCDGCYGNSGFFTHHFHFKEHININEDWAMSANSIRDTKLKKEYSFIKDKGFNTTKGCSIPRSQRSLTCRLYKCGNEAEITKPFYIAKQAYYKAEALFGSLEGTTIQYIDDITIKLEVDNISIKYAIACGIIANIEQKVKELTKHDSSFYERIKEEMKEQKAKK